MNANWGNALCFYLRVCVFGSVAIYASLGGRAQADVVYFTSGSGIYKVGQGGSPTLYTGNQFSAALGIALDSSGNLFYGNNGNGVITEVSPSGSPTTFYDEHTTSMTFAGLAIGPGNTLYATERGGGDVVKITAGGTRTLVGGGLFHPDSVALATDGTAYTYDEDGTIAKITSGGVVSTFATGVSDGPAVDASGNVYAAVGNEIDEFTPAGARSTFATGLSIPSSLVFGPEGDLYVDNRGTDELLAVDQSGNASVFASGPIYGTASGDAAFLAVGVPEPELLTLSALSLLAFRRGHRV